MYPSWSHHKFEVSADPARIAPVVVHRCSTASYWAAGIPIEAVERALLRSLCFGLFAGAGQTGFARGVTDRATSAHPCDFHKLEAWRGRGLGRWLMRVVRIPGLLRLGLVTRDAHGLYEQFGFTPIAAPQGHMEILCPGLYMRPV